MGFEHQTIFNRKLLSVITVPVLGVAASEGANHERFNVVTGLELNQQRWPLCFCPSRLSVAGTVERWVTFIFFESIAFGLRGSTRLRAYVPPTDVLLLKLVSGKPQKKSLTSQTGSGETLLPTHLQRLVICLMSDWFANHIVGKPSHDKRPLVSILSRCWNSVSPRGWRFWIRRWRQHGIYLLTVCPYFPLFSSEQCIIKTMETIKPTAEESGRGRLQEVVVYERL